MASNEKSLFSLYILKKDIFQIPCFKQTMIYSVSSWIGVGLLTFLCTSRAAFSSHCGFASYMIVSLGYFANCRIQHRKKELLAFELENAILKRNILEGTQNNEENKPADLVFEDV